MRRRRRQYYDQWPPYVPVAERRRQAARKVTKLRKSGQDINPVEIEGRQITTTFWGNSWCRNLEAYSDYSNRLPRGRTYVRNGSVIDLRIEKGRIRALVSGTNIYEIEIKIKRLPQKRWTAIKRQCGGKIDSLVELLQGKISKGVMEIVTRPEDGLFPSPEEITLDCSCPDWAVMCKHVAATLFGVGARLDREPEMLFTLRGVDPKEMVTDAVIQTPTKKKSTRRKALKEEELSSVFGIDLDLDDAGAKEDSTKPARGRQTKRAAKKSKVKKTPAKAAAKKATSKKKVAKKKVAKKKKAATKKPTVKATRKKAAKKKVTRKKAQKS